MKQAAGIKWLSAALNDVSRIHAFIHLKSASAAARAAKLILSGADSLLDAPEIGRPLLDETGRRELVVPFGAGHFVLLYRLQNQDTVIIMRVWHSRENRE